MKNLILFLTILAFAGCTGKPNNERALAVEVDLAKTPSPQQKSAQDGKVEESVTSRKLIKEGFIEFETSDIEKIRSQITASVSSNNGYISSDLEQKSADKISYTLIVRVPAIKFDAFLNASTKGITNFDHKEIDVKDVTADYFDTEARLKTKKEIESRYLQLLNKASGVKDILAIEKELGTIRTEIESAEGQLKLLTDQVQYSTLRINFYKITTTPSLFGYQVRSAFVKGWENLLFVLVLLVDLWPFILLFTGLWFVLSKIKKKRVEETVTIKNQQ